jgi:putative ABC transport system ATP-binding protein
VQRQPDPDANRDIVFRARDVSKTYQMGEVEVHALRSVSLDLYAGELLVILGASGSGKSTFLNILGGLDIPTTGSVRYRDRDLSEADEDELTLYRRENVGFGFQCYNLSPSLTAAENVALFTDISSDPMPANEALGLVGLQDRFNHFPAQLSGGEQQRVAIARAVAKRPDVLLCDEPTGALDLETGQLVLRVIDKVNREIGTTTALITHNAAIAALGDRVIRLSSGEISSRQSNEERAPIEEIRW